MKVALIIPCPQLVEPIFAIQCLHEMMDYTKERRKKVEIGIFSKIGTRTDKTRNACVKEAMEWGADWFLHLDADMIFPKETIVEYLSFADKNKVDVIGCMYFKRDEDFSPIGYISSGNPTHPYRSVIPRFIREGNVYEVEGLGFGGMMVAKHVYDKLGDKKWAVYGSNFHIPDDNLPDRLTHDLNFCKDVKAAGMSIKLHGSIRPKHIGKSIVDEDYWKLHKKLDQENLIKIAMQQKVVVIMPSIKMDMANTAAEIMKIRAGMPVTIEVVEDTKKEGFVNICNRVSKEYLKKGYNLFAYTAQDAYVSKGWLLSAVMSQIEQMAGLIAFNDGKWWGKLAQFGMMTDDFMKNYLDGNMLPPHYFGNYTDCELTLIAMQNNQFGWAQDSIMMEIDPEKDKGNKRVNTDDKKTFNERKLTRFDGKVTDPILLGMFS